MEYREYSNQRLEKGALGPEGGSQTEDIHHAGTEEHPGIFLMIMKNPIQNLSKEFNNM